MCYLNNANYKVGGGALSAALLQYTVRSIFIKENIENKNIKSGTQGLASNGIQVSK